MGKVQWVPWWWAVAGVAGLLIVGRFVPLSAAAWAAGAGYLVVSTVLLTRGLRRRRADRFGAANAVTATRSAMVGIITALVVAALEGAASTPLLVTLAAVALALDGVDGYVARRTATQSELGARFDMEVDAYLLLVLCVYDVRLVGWWVLVIGLLRYAFVVAGWLLPWMRRPLPPRYWRKVVTAVCGVALTIVASQLLPPIAGVVVAGLALIVVLESFGRDVLWLARLNRRGAALVSLEEASTIAPQQESR
ncbi:CDP-alcohol phosphatidyltransferase family protein [Microbacterium hibisci]|uniref:CDP-alcohol phosphatidyltransferase family protein n=1 Tax=Microbacterium hibisci TaxID=2036000 RepID=UPI0019429AE4|nr:CDP-alcohol phosphatidyltransferase family protein [Microbacterium hibisci]